MGRNVARLRAERGLSLRELAEKSGTSPATLNRLEIGQDANPTLATLIGLSHALGLHSIEELFGPLPSAHLIDSVEIEEPKSSATA